MPPPAGGHSLCRSPCHGLWQWGEAFLLLPSTIVFCSSPVESLVKLTDEQCLLDMVTVCKLSICLLKAHFWVLQYWHSVTAGFSNISKKFGGGGDLCFRIYFNSTCDKTSIWQQKQKGLFSNQIIIRQLICPYFGTKFMFKSTYKKDLHSC